jgi:hypothetical protein
VDKPGQLQDFFFLGDWGLEVIVVVSVSHVFVPMSTMMRKNGVKTGSWYCKEARALD